MREEKGITMAALIITIVVLVILAGVSITTGLSASKDIKDKKLQAELEMVQHAVIEQYQKYKVTNQSSDLKGTNVNKSVVSGLLGSVYSPTKADGYYRLTPSQLEQIGIQKAEDTYIVHYETGFVINETNSKKFTGDILYLKEINLAVY